MVKVSDLRSTGTTLETDPLHPLEALEGYGITAAQLPGESRLSCLA